MVNVQQVGNYNNNCNSSKYSPQHFVLKFLERKFFLQGTKTSIRTYIKIVYCDMMTETAVATLWHSKMRYDVSKHGSAATQRPVKKRI
jgi:hypothetical protein